MENKMTELAELFGLELYEVFNMEGHITPFRFTKNGLEYLSNVQNKWYKTGVTSLESIITGKEKIIKKPFRPKDKEHYYYVAWYFDQNWKLTVTKTYFTCNNSYDNLNRDSGNCFRTLEEAENAKYEIFKKFTGMDWKEIFGEDKND